MIGILRGHSFQPTHNCLRNSQTEVYPIRANDSILPVDSGIKMLYSELCDHCIDFCHTYHHTLLTDRQRRAASQALIWTNSVFRAFFPSSKDLSVVGFWGCSMLCVVRALGTSQARQGLCLSWDVPAQKSELQWNCSTLINCKDKYDMQCRKEPVDQ